MPVLQAAHVAGGVKRCGKKLINHLMRLLIDAFHDELHHWFALMWMTSLVLYEILTFSNQNDVIKILCI